MEVIRSHSPAKLAGESLSANIAQNSKFSILLLLSGGSAFSILEYVDETVFGPSVTVAVLDERFSTDPSVNNFCQLKQTPFFNKIIARGALSIETDVHTGDTLVSLTERFEKEIIDWKNTHEGGVVVVSMGIGADGHTAGILPGNYGIDWSGEKLVVAYKVPLEINPFTQRITTTYTFLIKYVDKAVVFAVGKDKQRIIDSLEKNQFDLEMMPAGILTKMSSVILFTDL